MIDSELEILANSGVAKGAYHDDYRKEFIDEDAQNGAFGKIDPYVYRAILSI